jgi:hypothetical protein
MARDMLLSSVSVPIRTSVSQYTGAVGAVVLRPCVRLCAAAAVHACVLLMLALRQMFMQSNITVGEPYPEQLVQDKTKYTRHPSTNNVNNNIKIKNNR